ncbi:MarR family transcriptional regulator [Amycolatopsis deserti]|uniref:MarR family transcriptional regulator n=1 Tax=Amycolatopsis deserti TaxID=185696 RepID=A0ABQ3IEH7_9PSEU|nr:MarR family transcriptional regulator [Amycolatopsis deserti]GHE77344.1 MarR family transcriptional regulator [Amycolatopsis deserti]
MVTEHHADDAPLTLYLVKRLELVIRSLMDDALRPFGLTTLQYTALTALRHRNGLSSAQLARRSFVRPQTMHTMVLTLEKYGLIERAEDPANRRVLLATLTERGRQVLDECTPLVRRLEDRMLSGMDETSRAAFRQGLEDGYGMLASHANAQRALTNGGGE